MTTVIDCDIHHLVTMKQAKPYLPRIYQDLVSTYGSALPSGVEAEPLGSAGHELASLQQQYLDKQNIACGILNGTSYEVQGTNNYDYAAAVCSAMNDYTVDQWLSRDKRLRGSIIIPKQQPQLAVEEIERLADNRAMVQVLASGGASMLYGNRYYYPIYEACVRHNLPFAIHAGMEGAGVNLAVTGAGNVSYTAEYKAARTQTMMAHLGSMIFEGVFERFPDLRVVFLEAGVFWLVPHLWRLDQDWKGLRVQTPWVREKPSEYVRKHIRLATTAMEPANDEELFDQFVELLDGGHTLMHGSNFPYGGYERSAEAWSGRDAQFRQRIMHDNAAEWYGLAQ